MRWSFSRAECYAKCPYQFKLRYLDELEVERDIEAADPLVVGTAMHEAIEQGIEKAVANYHANFPISGDAHVAEEIKLRAMAAKVHLPKGGLFEVRINKSSFLGFVDYAVLVGEKLVDLYDFKYTAAKNADRYRESAQLPVYAWYLEKTTNLRVRGLHYLIIPKTSIRQKTSETVQQFRNRLEATLAGMEPIDVVVPYDREKVIRWMETVIEASNATEFPTNQTSLCGWCDYRQYCETEGKDTSMILPKNEKRDISAREHVKVWVYGEPFTGKTVFADGFPDALMLNTDGNIGNVTAPYLMIAETTEQEGRITKTVHGWDTLKEAVAELEKGSEFRTVVVDLVEDCYELCRTYIYDKRGWEHESDDSFRAWDIVRKEFLDLMRRVTNLPMNVVLVSHEDVSKDITGRSGSNVTAIKPNIPDKVAKKLAGMVDIVARTVVRDGRYLLTFKTEEFIFGGGRMALDVTEVPTSFANFAELVGLNHAKPAPKPVPESAPEQEPEAEEQPVRRVRRKREGME